MPQETLTTTAERTLRLVELLLAHPDGLTPQDMLPHLGVSRSSLFILLRTLKTLGYVEQAERRGRYRCGPRLQAWQVSSGETNQNLLSAFYQEAGSRDWPETLALTIPVPQGLLVLAQVEGSQQIRSVYTVGEVVTTSPASRSVLNPSPPQPVRANGFASDSSDQLLELALPVCPDGSRPQAALVLSAPAYRWQVETLLAQWLNELRAMAARLSYRMGAVTYTPYQQNPAADLPPSAALSGQEISAFLQGPWTARLACIRTDGRPHVIPVWQEWDGEVFTLIAWEGSQWAEYVRQNPEVSLTIDEPWPPLRRIVAQGQAVRLHWQPASPELGRLVARLSQRYLGEPELATKSGRVIGAYRVVVENLRGWKGLPGPVSRGEDRSA